MGEGSANWWKGKRVVVTRAAEQGGTLVEALQERGAAAVILPMVAFGPPYEPGLVDEAIRGGGRYDWMLLTSQNALRALQERSDALGMGLAQALRGVRIAAVGPATADAARNVGLPVEYVAEKHHGAGLAEELGERVKGKRVLLPRSDRANPELVGRLEERGAIVTDVVAYKTVRPDDRELAKAKDLLKERVDAVLFFSSSAVHHLKEVLGETQFLELSRRSLFAAIGPVTEKALRAAKVERVAMAKDTTIEAVLATLDEQFATTGAKLPAGTRHE